MVPTLWRSTLRSTRAAMMALWLVSLFVFLIKAYTVRRLAEPVPFADIIIPYVQLVPRHAIFYPWVFVTAIFAEVSILFFLLSNLVLYVATNYVEKFWGSKEVARFLLIVGGITNFSTVLLAIISNIFRGDIISMGKPLGGGISYYFGFLVVLKQLIPEHNVVLFQGVVNFRVKHLPFIALVCVSAWSAVARLLYPAVPSVISFLTSYMYLRFQQLLLSDPLLPLNGDSTMIRGDASDAFQLVEFFPSVLKPYMSVVFDSVHRASVFLGLITPFNDEVIEQSNLRAQKMSEQVNQANRQVANSVAERRRQVALQVIEERVNSPRS